MRVEVAHSHPLLHRLKAHGALKHLFPSSHSGSSSTSSDKHNREPLEEKIEWAHAYHENCPDSLDCLPDTDGKPQYTLPVILRCVILGSAKKRLTIREIYAAMEKKYPYYKSAAPAWKVCASLSGNLYSVIIYYYSSP